MPFNYFGYTVRCSHCREVFHSDECIRRAEYVDDSHIPAFYVPICPFCGSDELEEYEDPEEDSE